MSDLTDQTLRANTDVDDAATTHGGERTRSRLRRASTDERARRGSLRRFRPDSEKRPLHPSPAQAPRAGAAAAARAWLARHALSLPIAAALLVVAGVALGSGVGHYPALADDEGTYVAQAWSFAAHGALSHYTYWYDHPPLGWIQLAVAGELVKPLLAIGPAVSEARELMLIPALASCALLYVLARRLGLRRAFAAAAVLLFALSPLAVSSLRMVYLDNVATPWLLAAFVLAASPRTRLWAYAGSGACFAVAILTKETTLLALPGLVVAIGQGLDRRTRPFCLAAFGSTLVLAVLAYPLYALLKGELVPGPGHVSLVDALRFQLYGRASSGSPLDAHSLAHRLVASWLATDPWLIGIGTAAVLPALWIRRLRPAALVVAVLAAVAARPGYLPQPYVIGLLPFCALLIAGALDGLWGQAEVSVRGVARRGAVAAAALAATVVVVPAWAEADRSAAHSDQTSSQPAAERWIEGHVDRRARLLVDDTFYVDLVRGGFKPQFGVVWFYKLDFTTNLDPSVARHLPLGWREFDYVVSTPVIRSALSQNPGGLQQVRLALANSRAVATFGSGSERVELRRISGEGTGSGLIPPLRPARPRVAAPHPAHRASRAPVRRHRRHRRRRRRRR